MVVEIYVQRNVGLSLGLSPEAPGYGPAYVKAYQVWMEGLRARTEISRIEPLPEGPW